MFKRCFKHIREIAAIYRFQIDLVERVATTSNYAFDRQEIGGTSYYVTDVKKFVEECRAAKKMARSKKAMSANVHSTAG